MGRRSMDQIARDEAKKLQARVHDLVTAHGPSAGLLKVTIVWSFDWLNENASSSEGEDSMTEYIVADEQFLAFLQAIRELHHEPGFNPHSRLETNHALCVTIATLVSRGPYWWSTPGLGSNDDPRGAVIFEWEVVPTVIWTRPGFTLPAAFTRFARI